MSQPHLNEIIHVTQPTQIPAALQLLARSDYVALDTEFLREDTYYAKLCLIQLAHDNACVLFDVIALGDLTPLYEFLCDPTRIKVLHAARQDIEALLLSQNHPNLLPTPLFDTQVAAGLLGLSANIGFADLVTTRLGYTLTKGHARTDWARRPLSNAQLEYAADDVRYLAPLYHDLNAALLSTGRMQWLQEEMQSLYSPALYRTTPDAAWKRLKGHVELEPKQRAVLKSLAAWREQRAIHCNKPRGWIFNDEALRLLAERCPSNIEQLQTIRALPAAVIHKHAAALLELIQTADASNESAAVVFRPIPTQRTQVNALMKQIRTTCEQLHIHPELLATRREIEQFVYFNKTGRFAQGWRHTVIGDVLFKAKDT